MPKFDLECTYCGHRWQATFWSKEYAKNISCPNGKCNDKNIKMRSLGEEGTNDVFGYSFDPKKKDKKNYYQ